MTEEQKEELMSLFICLASIVILWMCFVSGLIDSSTELHVIYITFMVLHSFIRPFSKLGLMLCMLPFGSAFAICGESSLVILAEASEIITYYVIGGFVNRVFVKQVIDGFYMKFLGYQVFNIICGNVVWAVVLLILNTCNDYPFSARDFFTSLIQRLAIILLHMLVCNKPLTNYFAERAAEE